MGNNLRTKMFDNLLSSLTCFTLAIIVVCIFLFSSCNFNNALEESENVSVVSEQVNIEEEADTVPIYSAQPIYGIITDIGVFEFPAYNSADSIVTLGMTFIVVSDSVGNETKVTFLTGLYLLGDSLRGVFIPGIGVNTSFFTERYAPQCRPVIDEVILGVDGHLAGFSLTEDLANDLCSRPAIRCEY